MGTTADPENTRTYNRIPGAAKIKKRSLIKLDAYNLALHY